MYVDPLVNQFPLGSQRNQLMLKSSDNESFIKRTTRRAKEKAMTGIEVEKFKINLNTVVAVFGFLSTFAFLLTIWNDTKNDVEDTNRWIEQHTSVHANLSAELSRLHAVDASRDTQVAEITFKIGQLEKGTENLSDRMNRVTENTNDQFTEFRTQLGSLITQLALANQSLARLEIAGRTTTEVPRELRK